jgi:phosphonate transport system substrate-binding protein
MLFHRVIAGMLLILWFFGRAPDIHSAERVRVVPPASEALRLVIVPEKNAFILRSQYKPVIDFISQKIGKNIYLEVSTDYLSAVQSFEKGDADAGFLGSYSYLLARERAKVEPLVRPLWPEKKNICRSYIISRKADGINELLDMKGSRLAVVDRNSLTGFIFADCLFKNSGIPEFEQFFRKIIWAASHDNAIWAVVTGEADVGVAKSRVYDDLLKEYPEELDKLLVINRSAEVPTICFVVGRDYPLSERDRLLFLFSQMDKTEEGRNALAVLGAESFAKAYDAEYDPLRKMFEKSLCSVASEKEKEDSREGDPR